jgi:2'-5' RNA ligase
MSKEYSSQLLRLFLAITIPPDVCNSVKSAQNQLRQHTPAGLIRWSRPEQFHITLKFLGDVASDGLDELENSVFHICRVCPVLNLSAHGIGFFPNSRKPSVVWVGAEDDEGKLAELQRLLEESLRPFLTSAKPEKFTGHITLGRFRPGPHSTIENLMKCAMTLREQHFGNWLATEVQIVQSELTATGVIHTPVRSCPLMQKV